MGSLRIRGGLSAGVLVGTLLAGSPTPAMATDRVCPADECVMLTGEVRRAGDRVRLGGTALLVADTTEPPAWVRRVQTTSDGTFEVAVPRGPVRIVVLLGGFERYDHIFGDEDRPLRG